MKCFVHSSSVFFYVFFLVYINIYIYLCSISGMVLVESVEMSQVELMTPIFDD